MKKSKDATIIQLPKERSGPCIKQDAPAKVLEMSTTESKDTVTDQSDMPAWAEELATKEDMKRVIAQLELLSPGIEETIFSRLHAFLSGHTLRIGPENLGKDVALSSEAVSIFLKRRFPWGEVKDGVFFVSISDDDRSRIMNSHA